MPARSRKSRYSKKQLIVVVSILVVVGIFLVIFIRAAAPSSAVEAEQGTRAGNASVSNDATASAGSYLKFNQSTSGGLLPTGYGQTNGPSGTFQTTLSFDDEFNGSALESTKWNSGWVGSPNPVQSQELGCYEPSQVTVGPSLDGSTSSLRLKAIDAPLVTENGQQVRDDTNCNKGGHTHPYKSGAVDSNNHYRTTYGFFEARIWLDGNGSTITNWPAWWIADSPNYTGEIDIIEGLGGTAKSTLHFPGGSTPVGSCPPSSGGCVGWHTFGVDWATNGTATTYYDGIKIGSQHYPLTTGHMLILGMQMGPQGQYGGPIKVPTEMDVDYVRVWKR